MVVNAAFLIEINWTDLEITEYVKKELGKGARNQDLVDKIVKEIRNEIDKLDRSESFHESKIEIDGYGEYQLTIQKGNI
jgi:hypothetical protein